MSTSSLPPKSRWFGGVGCALTFALGVPAILLLTCLSGWLYFRYQHAGYTRQLAEQEQRVRDAGEPLTGAELNEWYRVPEGEENLTELYLTIFETMQREEPANKTGVPWFDPDVEPESIPLPGEPWTDIARSEAFLANYEETFKLLEETLEREGSVRYPVDYRDGIAMRLPHLQQLRSLLRLCEVRATVLAHRGEHNKATDCLIVAMKAAEVIQQEPCLVSQLVRVAIHGAVDEAIAFTLTDENYPVAQVERLRDKLIPIDRDGASYTAFVGERAGFVYQALDGTLDELRQENGSDQQGIGGVTDQSVRVLRPGDCALTLEFCSDAVEASGGRYPEIWARQQKVAANTEAVLLSDRDKLPWDMNIVAALLAPASDAAFKAFARGAAQHRCTLILLAAELHRRERGDYPQRLEDLAPVYLPTLPADPYTGEPLRMKHAPGGRFIVYTTGPDGIDDDGDIDTLPGDQARDTGLSVPPLRAPTPTPPSDGE